MNKTTSYRFALVIAVLAMALHAYQELAKSTAPSPEFFLLSMAPYAMCLAVWSRANTGVPAALGVSAALMLDLFAHYAVFVEPRSSTAPLALLFIPVWSLLIFCPGIMLVAWFAVRQRRAVIAEQRALK